MDRFDIFKAKPGAGVARRSTPGPVAARVAQPAVVRTPIAPIQSAPVNPRATEAGQRSYANRFQGKGAWKRQIDYADEQQAVINCRAKTVVVNAFAGTGKTTTAEGLAAARPESRILYMPFGKTVQMQALDRFPPNTWCQTINSAAWDAASPALKAKLTNNFTPLLLRDEMNIKGFREAAYVLKLLRTFMSSAETEIRFGKAREVLVESGWSPTDSETQSAISLARLTWFRMIDESDKMPLPHDALLKLWSMRKPRLDYDIIIFDEAQDTNAVTAEIIRQQDHATRIYIGDRHQAIYGFRGALNAMEAMSQDKNAAQLYLSRTWRFGPKIADVANMILGDLKGEQKKIVGMGSDSPWKSGASYTRLSRTNAQLFRDAASRNGVGIHWAGPNGIAGYNLSRLSEAYNLFSSKECKDSELKRFRSWGEAQDYAEESKDGEIRMLVSIVDEFRNETPNLVRSLVTNEVREPEKAEVIFTTAHKSKGLDWDFVELADDFSILADTEEALAEDALAPINEQEINLLYVAATRAKKTLHVDKETSDWMANIETHRIGRNIAQQRLEQRRQAARTVFR